MATRTYKYGKLREEIDDPLDNKGIVFVSRREVSGNCAKELDSTTT